MPPEAGLAVRDRGTYREIAKKSKREPDLFHIVGEDQAPRE
jgi:hypothetical protein